MRGSVIKKGNRWYVKIELDPDPMQKTVYRLQSTVAIRRIELRVVERETGKQRAGHSGLAEIELRMERR